MQIVKKMKIECARCGACCRTLHLFYTNTEANLEWIRARGIKIVQISKTHIEARVQHICPQLRGYDDLYECISHKNKPMQCKAFPFMNVDYASMGLNRNLSFAKKCAFRNEN